ncbi:BsuBI/PstI family type II restriction endonuclease [[Mycobacterium] vasticus]|uniref:BsuBI/PstI family type II restriction endonuclease n=1 Tax=[Mycobacterium] vasticus TaxID=2875777 RepID=A0ABU5Z2L6_9MYCO|nr:BsuBI/PstI family type II restriction endonuclease [Mycolicibacter sp. MYC017]MEB3071613.1 BsuBI/PstI family type II restriction endonuclease [Mycolicibacter sp. MYC017]
MSSPLAGAAVAAMIYVDAVATDDDNTTFWARPSMVMWMSDEMRTRASEAERITWRVAAAKNNKYLVEVLNDWDVPIAPDYADNSRETLRDETFRKWRDSGALRERPGVPKNSGNGRWALEAHFADLFNPSLSAIEFETAAELWRDQHLSPAAKLKVQFAAQGQQATHAVHVTLPGNRGVRHLEAGRASQILKGVIEDWAPIRLEKPFVVTISEPGDKIFTADADLLNYLGVAIISSNLLPDAIIADITSGGDVYFWFVEAVNTDGEINESRRISLLAWAEQQSIDTDHCYFLTAFSSRNDAAARKRLKDLAVGTFAYFADEPERELAWYVLGQAAPKL